MVKSKAEEYKATAQQTLKNNANVEYDQEKLQGSISSVKEDFKKIMYRALQINHTAENYAFVSFYDFVEKNITHRLPNSLDEFEKQSQEALSLLEEEIKKLEWLNRQKQNEQSNQPQEALQKPSPADKLQTYLETTFKDANITDQWKHTVTSYMHGLFEKSHHQSLVNAKIAKFYQTNIEEAKQVGEYLEQKHFIHHKIRDDVIQLAIHLKHAFGFPLHQASIDKDFTIVKSKDESAVARLEINSQGKILKGNRVQRVYLIGFQDASEASSSDADAKPMALLAMQSTETGYPKYGAGTPLPTGGVVDVVTAQHTTPDQPNLYKATLAIETLQETHEQKDVDMQTLELFETETVMNPHTKTCLYDITTFTGKVKDKPSQALPEHSKPEEAYQETTGPCIVDLNKLLSTVRNIIEGRGRFCPLWRAMMYIR